MSDKPTQPLQITLRQAEKLLAFFGGHDTEVSVAQARPDQPPGLYAWCTEYPEEGAAYLGPTEVDGALAETGRTAGPNSPSPEMRKAAQEVVDLLNLIKHATAPDPDDGGGHENAFELADKAITAMQKAALA